MYTGLNIKYLRTRKGFRQKELGNIIGVGEAQISKYERGESVVPSDKLEKIADFFKVSLDDIVKKNLKANPNLDVVNEPSSIYGQAEKTLLEIAEKLQKQIDRYEEAIKEEAPELARKLRL